MDVDSLRYWPATRIDDLRDMGVPSEWEAGFYSGKSEAYEEMLDILNGKVGDA